MSSLIEKTVVQESDTNVCCSFPSVFLLLGPVTKNMILILMLECSQLLGLTTLPSLSAPHLGKTDKKAQILFCNLWEIQLIELRPTCWNSRPLAIIHTKPVSFPQPIFKPAWEPSMLSPESFLIQVIKLFIASRCVCGIIHLNIQTKILGGWGSFHFSLKHGGTYGKCTTMQIAKISANSRNHQQDLREEAAGGIGQII